MTRVWPFPPQREDENTQVSLARDSGLKFVDLERGDLVKYLQVRDYYAKETKMDKTNGRNMIQVMSDAYMSDKRRVQQSTMVLRLWLET